MTDGRSGTNGWSKGTWQFSSDLKASQPSESNIGAEISVDELSLLRFEINELEQLIEEKAAEQDEVALLPRRRRKSRQRVLADNLPREEIVHELPKKQRQCPIAGKPMPVIR